MRAVKRLLAPLLLVVALLSIVTAPTASAANCVVKTTSDMRRTSVTTKWIDVGIQVHFRQCVSKNGKRHFIDPISYTAWYNREGGSMSCSGVHVFQKVHFNGYFWDGTGKNWNPGGVYLPCSVDTHAEKTFTMTNAPNFDYCNGPPKWKFNGRVAIWGHPDSHFTLSKPMWAFTGPVRNHC